MASKEKLERAAQNREKWAKQAQARLDIKVAVGEMIPTLRRLNEVKADNLEATLAMVKRMREAMKPKDQVDAG